MANMLAHNQTKLRPKPSGANRGADIVAFFGLFALFAVVTAVLFWQWMPHLHSALIGPPEDNMQDFWNSWYAAVARSPDSFFLPI
jgi:hypothetical protein